MRNLIIGIVLGVWITSLFALLERHRWMVTSDIMFYLLTVLLVILIIWRGIILKVILRVNPRFWLWLNDWGRSSDYETIKKQVAERKAEQKRQKG